MSDATDGDVRPTSPGSARIHERLAGSRWTTVRQVHGAKVIQIDHAMGATDIEADGIVTAAPDTPIAMLGADCGLIAFASREGPIGIAHAGWKGLVEGVIGNTVERLRSLGATEVRAACSPMIHPECYEFSPDDLDSVAALLGDGVRSTTSQNRPAFDLLTGVTEALARADVEVVASLGGCTACDDGWYSWRARRDEARHGLVCWERSR
jgi:hypothetical protein